MCLSVYHFVLVFSVLLVLRLPRLGKRELILVLFVRLCGLCLFGFVGFLFSWGLGRAAVCECGTPWTFSYLFFLTFLEPSIDYLNFEKLRKMLDDHKI